jgi:hypothetical protein
MGGVEGRYLMDTRIRRGVTKLHLSLTCLEKKTKEGNSPVSEKIQTPWMLFPSTMGYTSLWEFRRTIS